MRKGLLTTALASMSAMCGHAQYAPQAGISGTMAVHRMSGQISTWANNCLIYRGLQDIAQPQLGVVSTGDRSLATGQADGFVVSLGDSGVAVLTFAQPISNLSGADFAVFENGFADPANIEMAFLELAFVEVSSDGQHYFRFPAFSSTQSLMQVAGAGDYMNARKIHNLAGKYVGQYGTPFDLEDLAGTTGLDLNAITHIRLVDVIGSIGAHASLDDSGRAINDPYPTPFPTGGFDLDAVAVLHGSGTGIGGLALQGMVNLYPNPANGFVQLSWPTSKEHTMEVKLMDATGRLLYYNAAFSSGQRLDLQPYEAGLYFFHFKNNQGAQWSEKVVVLH